MVSVAIGEGINADVDESIDILQHMLCTEARRELGPTKCRFAPFKPDERAGFEAEMQHFEIPADDIADYLRGWDSLRRPVAVVHFGSPLFPTTPARSRWN